MTRRPDTRLLPLAAALLACPAPGGGVASTDAASTTAPVPTTTGAPTSTTTGPAAPTTTATSTTGVPTSTTGTTTTDTTAAATTAVTEPGTTDDTTTGDGTTGVIGETLELPCDIPGSTSDGPASPDVAPECACIDATGHLICEAPLCPSMFGDCGWVPDDTCPAAPDALAAALDCAIAAAREGTPGTLLWEFTPDQGWSSRSGFLQLVAGRRAIRQDYHRVDLGGPVSDTELWALKDPAYFQGCLELASVCARLDCFFAGTDGPALSLCHPAFLEGGI